MEEIKVIALCNYCGDIKEVIPLKDTQKMICAECLIDLHDRLEGYFLPASKHTNDNVKENLPCQQLAIAATGS
jgi:hypothetical protein